MEQDELRFKQIAASVDEGEENLYGLDEDGVVWSYGSIGRERGWSRLTMKRFS